MKNKFDKLSSAKEKGSLTYRRKRVTNDELDPFGELEDEVKITSLPKPIPRLKSAVQDTVIDYPRHIHISSESQDLRQLRNTLREQKFFHLKFDPSMQNYSNRHIYSGVYTPNQRMNPAGERQISAKEYIRATFPKNMN